MRKRVISIYGGNAKIQVDVKTHRLKLEITYYETKDLIVQAMNFLSQIKTEDWDKISKIYPPVAANFRNQIIQILEEKFGYKCVAPKEVSEESSKLQAIKDCVRNHCYPV